MQKILIADDSIAVRKVAERLLAEAGLGVVLAANGEEALAYLKKDCPDAVVSDVIMPDKSGYEVCAFVRATAALAATPVLLISGIVNDEVTKQAETCRADGVLKKPFQGTSLKDKVLELIAKRQKLPEATESKSTSAPAAPPTNGSKSMPVPQQAVGQILAPGIKPVPTQAALPVGGADAQIASKLKQTEGRLQAEQVRAETLLKRTVELEAELGRMKGVQALLEAERRRATELESKIGAGESLVSRVPQLEAALKTAQDAAREARQEAAAAQALASRVPQLEAALKTAQDAAREARQEAAAAQALASQVPQLEAALKTAQDAACEARQEATAVQALASRVPQLEAALKTEQEAARKARHDAAAVQMLAERVAQLEAELSAERAAAAQLVQQLSDMETTAASAAKTAQQVVELQAALAAERQKGAVGMQGKEEAQAKVRELDGILSAERERNAALLRRVTESEQAALIATTRLEEMVRRLGQIAGLASQFGKGIPSS